MSDHIHPKTDADTAGTAALPEGSTMAANTSTTEAMPVAKPSGVAKVAEWLALFIHPDDVAELLALEVPQQYGRPATMVGYFDGQHLEDMARQALALTRRGASGVYFTFNPLQPAILARSVNRVKRAGQVEAASNQHIACRRWLLIDVDPERMSGVSATDAEKAAAREIAQAIYRDLGSRGWPSPIVADSGNGWHLLYPIALPTDDGRLVERCLGALAQRHDTDAAKVDRSVHNPARLARVPGTYNCKGDSTPDRPHRRARIVQIPSELQPVPADLLHALATETTPPASASAPQRNGKAVRNPRLDVPRWLTARSVAFRQKDATDAKGRTVYVLECCPFDPSHTAPDAAIFQHADGKLGFRCFHDSCASRGWQDAKQKIGSPDPGHYDPPLNSRRPRAAETTEGGAEEKPSQAAELVELALGAVDLFHDGDTPYATLAQEPRTWRLMDRAFAQQLRHWYYEETEKAPAAEALRSAIDTLAGRALFDGPALSVCVRVAGLDGAIYLDLGREDWSAVRITPDGWDVVTTYPVRFRHPRGMLPLPAPEGGGNLPALRQLLNLDDTCWRLVLAWLLAAFRPTGPYPVLILTGEQGAAKSTTARLLRSLIDPNAAPLRSEPRDGRDVVIAAGNSWVCALDNLSYLPPWLSDCLCRLATGGGFATRELYTNSEEVIFDSQRPVILTSIEDVAERGDLLDRAVIVRLPPIPEERRRPESEFWATADAARPAILGALLDVVAAGLRKLPNIRLTRLPRMADFARWATACEPAQGLPAGAFMAAYAGNVAEANELALDGSPIWPVLRQLVERSSGAWEGTAADLLKELERLAGLDGDKAERSKAKRPKRWPGAAHVLSGRLRRLAPNARRAGIAINFDRGGGTQNGKMIHLQKVGAEASGASEASEPLEITKEPLPSRPHSDASAPGLDASRTPVPQTENRATDGVCGDSDASDASDAQSATFEPNDSELM
jgi:hypothetical protein